jgi:DNA-binding transcriptional MerR regulator/SAM-dependent methyltransferase
MRIGEFAKKHGVTIDTVRHYMELELIIPEKVGGQYFFDETCNSEIEEILWLKKANFTLNEVQRIITLKRITRLKNDEDVDYYKSLMMDKRDELISERERIDSIISIISSKIDDMSISNIVCKKKLGVPLGFLNFLSCPKCNKSLGLASGNIENNAIIQGKLECSCGFSASITDGIIRLETSWEVQTDIVTSSTIKEYMEDVAIEYINLLHRTKEWMTKKIDFSIHHPKVILDLGSGSGMFLKNIQEQMPEEIYYILTDHNLNLIKYVKGLMESSSKHNNFIFICSDLLELPIENESVDIVIDYLGSTNFNFYKPGFLIKLLDSKVKPLGKWVGSYFYFKQNSKFIQNLNEECRPYFYFNNIIKAFEGSSFKAIDSKDFGYVERAGEIFEPFMVEGDKLFHWTYYGEKKR